MSKFLIHPDFDGNQLLRIKLEDVATDPSGAGEHWKGRVIYNSTSDVIKVSDGTAWQALGTGTISSILNDANGGLTVNVSGSNVTLSVNVDNSTLEKESNSLRVKDLGITSAKLAANAVSTVKVADGAITFSKAQNIPSMTVWGRTAAGSGVASAISIISAVDLSGASHTNIPTALAVKNYIDNTVSSIGRLRGTFNANTETNFPGGPGVNMGDSWYINAPGTVQGEVFNNGDLLIATKSNPSTTATADWVKLESNRDQASTTILGFVMLATNAEAQAGSNNTKALTPAALASVTATEARRGLIEIATLAEGLAGTDAERAMTSAVTKAVIEAAWTAKKFMATIGNGTLTSIPVTHNLGTLDVNITMYEVATGKTVFAGEARTSTTVSTFTFSKAPATGAIRVVIAA